MISVKHLKNNLHQLFKLAEGGGITFKLHYKDMVFDMKLQPTGEVYHGPRKRRKRSDIKGGIRLYVDECPQCNSVRVEGRCISKTCASKRVEVDVEKAPEHKANKPELVLTQ